MITVLNINGKYVKKMTNHLMTTNHSTRRVKDYKPLNDYNIKHLLTQK